MTIDGRLSRPQPVGILPIPAGLLVLPDAGALDAEARRRYMTADEPVEIPETWAFYEAARRQNWVEALACLSGADDPVSAYNRFVIGPTLEAFEELRGCLTGELRTLLDVAAFAVGVADEPPETGDLNGELLVLALMVQAAAAMEQHADVNSIPLLERAIEAARKTSPIFAAQLLGQLAGSCRTQPEPLHSLALKHYREAIALMGAARLPEVTTELWMQLGVACQESARGRHDWMTEAVGAYQHVLRGGLIPEEHAELFALAHNNLGLLFLSMNRSENGKQLSMAIAVQSFREGLRLCDRETNPELWASIQLNLANALQYLPSSHPEESLQQAVGLYEELITQHRKAFDPVGFGRILSNQANALAHLGIFSPALEKLQEARKLFEWHNETELANGAMEIAEQIHERLGAGREQVVGRA